MPIDPNLDFNFSPADQAAIHSAFDALLLLLASPSVPYVNLTKDERSASQSIGPKRLPYVNDAVNNILPVFTPLASLSIPLARTTTLFDLMVFHQSIAPKMAEVSDRFTDLGLNAEALVYQSMRHSYNTAQQQEGLVPGADVLLEAIAPLFADQGGNPNAEEPTP